MNVRLRVTTGLGLDECHPDLSLVAHETVCTPAKLVSIDV